MTTQTCEFCGDRLVPAYRGRNDILIVGEYPEIEDSNNGVPFRGQGGEILRYELSRVGNNIWDNNLCNFWLHDKNKNNDCFEMGVMALTREMAGRKVLLMGSEMSRYFLSKSITDVSGLEVKSPLFPNSVQFVMMSVSARSALHSTVGELRHAIETFIRRCNE